MQQSLSSNYQSLCANKQYHTLSQIKNSLIKELMNYRIKTIVNSAEFIKTVGEQLQQYKTFKYGEIILFLNFIQPPKREEAFLNSESFLLNYSIFVKMLESKKSTTCQFDSRLKRLILLYKGANYRNFSQYLAENILKFLANNGFLTKEVFQNFSFEKMDESQYMIHMLTQYIKECILHEDEYLEKLKSHIIPFLKLSSLWYKKDSKTSLMEYLASHSNI